MGKRLVLVGGGHVHLATLKRIDDCVRRGHRVTLISPSSYHYYSGMGPGMLSGIYRPQQVRFNVRKMAEDRGGVFIRDRVVRVDPFRRRLALESGEAVAYDVASFNVGSEVPVRSDAAFPDSVFPVKPIVNLLHLRRLILDEARRRVRRIVVIGGGPAGIEVAANVQSLLHQTGSDGSITLVSGDRMLSALPVEARERARLSLSMRGVVVREGVRMQTMGAGTLSLSDGSVLVYDYALLAVGVRPSRLFSDSGLPVAADGGLSVNRFLQSTGHPELFGGGDCVSVEGFNLARVGVYAVRQSGVLQHNMMAALDGDPMLPFTPQKSFMLILNLGGGRGMLCKRSLVWEGRLPFLVKDYIDRRFMRKFQVSGELVEAD